MSERKKYFNTRKALSSLYDIHGIMTMTPFIRIPLELSYTYSIK